MGAAVQLTKGNAEWLSAVKARGIACDTKEDIERVQIDAWPAGGYADEEIPVGHRAVRCIAFVRDDETEWLCAPDSWADMPC